MELRSWFNGELQGDPDIAGNGLVIAMWSLTALTVITSWGLWYSKILRRNDVESSREYRVLLKCALVLGDIQLCNALAITMASIILIRSDKVTSLYHIFIARGLTQANLSGHGAALIFDTTKQANWQLRLTMLAVVLVLYTYWTALCIDEFKQWRDVTPRCFTNYSRVPFWYTTWMYIDIPWTLIGYCWIFAETVGYLQAYLLVLNEKVLTLISDIMLDCHEAVTRLVQFKLFHGAFLIITAFLRAIAFLVLTITIGPPVTAPLASTLFLLWGIYDVETARRANRDILVLLPVGSENTSNHGHLNPEDDWGYGQLLPLILLILPLLQMADTIEEGMKHEQRTSAHLLDLDVLRRQAIFLSKRTRK